MKVTFVELRRNPSKLLKAIANNQEITLTRRGRDIARVVPVSSPKPTMAVKDHPAVGMWADREDMADPVEAVRKMRQGRYRDL